MRRGVILVVPLKVFAELEIELTRQTMFYGNEERKMYRDSVLTRLGVCDSAIEACEKWWENLSTDCILFRFQTDEDGSRMPEWSQPCSVRYDWNSFGDPGWKATMLNSYFLVGTFEPKKAAVQPRRFVSREG